MKVIQLRGTNSVGKTTAVRQFLQRGNYEKRQVIVRNSLCEYYFDESSRIAVLGRYDRNSYSGGIDGNITDRDVLLDAILRIARLEKANAIVFEGVLYGVTFKLTYELYRACVALGYRYSGILLQPPLQYVFDRIRERNGGKEVNEDSIANKYFTASRAAEKMKAAGIPTRIIDTSKVPLRDMYKIIEEEI